MRACTVVDNWHHDNVTHLAKVISVRDMREQVSLFVHLVPTYLVKNGSDFSSGPRHQDQKFHSIIQVDLI